LLLPSRKTVYRFTLLVDYFSTEAELMFSLPYQSDNVHRYMVLLGYVPSMMESLINAEMGMIWKYQGFEALSYSWREVAEQYC
jgi:hypothetical protein